MTDRPTSFPEARLPSNGVGGSYSVSPPRGKPKRKAIPVKVQVDVALYQSIWFGGRCPLCGNVLAPGAPRILEHMTPHATRTALGLDPDAFDNLRFVHAACAHKKTYGTKATTAGSDAHAIAKAKRLERAREAHRAALAGETRREPGKIKGRGFPKVHRPFRRAP